MIRLPVLIFRVTGRSMEPYARDGDYAVSMRIFFSIKVGDVVVFKNPGNDMTMIKRVSSERSGASGKEYFLEGDNKARSSDSRSFGYIGREHIIAKVLFVARHGRNDSSGSKSRGAGPL